MTEQDLEKLDKMLKELAIINNRNNGILREAVANIEEVTQG